MNAGTTSTYENIICLNTSGIDTMQSTIDIIENNFTFSLLISFQTAFLSSFVGRFWKCSQCPIS